MSENAFNRGSQPGARPAPRHRAGPLGAGICLGLLVTVLMAAGCARPILGASAISSPSEPIIVDARNHRIDAVMGQLIELRLPANPSTGYRWTAVDALPDFLVPVEEPRFISGNTRMAGAPGEERWVFQAKRPGSGTLKLEYRRSFEPANIAPAQRVSYQVEVR